MNFTYRSLFLTIIVAFVANIFIAYFIFVQISGVTSVTDDWHGVKSRSIETSLRLAEIERSFGYVGFIHNFKNYIIRGSDSYYSRTVLSLEKVSGALKAFENGRNLSEQQSQHIKTIKNTLDQYAKNLERAKSARSNVKSVQELDSLVKVDDSFAQYALEELRKDILPSLLDEKDRLDNHVLSFQKKTYLLGLCLIPLFLFSSYITVKTLRKLTGHLRELTAIFNASPNGIIYVDSSGRISREIANKSPELRQ